MDEALKRQIAAYLLSPRIRDSGRMENGKKVFDEDQQIAKLITEFTPPLDANSGVEAYYWYLNEIATAIDKIRPNDPKIEPLEHNEKLAAIRQVLRSATQVAGLEMFRDDLRNRDLNKIRAALAAHINTAGMETRASVATRAEEPRFAPIGHFDYAKRDLSIADSTINQATGGRFRSGEDMIKHIRAAEREIERLHAAGPVVENAEPGEYRPVTRKARDVFRSAIHGTLEPQELNFDVTVFEWTRPHPKVPAVDPNYNFMAKDLYEILWCVENGKNAVLVGPPGCGKTVATEQLAARLGRPYFRVPLDGEMRKREILGGFKQVFEDGVSVTKWFDGLVIEALKWPSILDMDEIDRGDPDLQYVAHQVYEGKGVTILEDEGRHVPPNKRFALIGTANTKGRAEGMNLYSLSAEMSEATRDRFPMWIEWDYMPADVETARLLQIVTGLNEDTAKKIVQIAGGLRASLVEGKIRTATSFRQVLTCGQYAAFLQKALGDPVAARVRAVEKVIVSRGSDEGEVAAMAELAKTALGAEWEARASAQAGARRP